MGTRKNEVTLFGERKPPEESNRAFRDQDFEVLLCVGQSWCWRFDARFRGDLKCAFESQLNFARCFFASGAMRHDAGPTRLLERRSIRRSSLPNTRYEFRNPAGRAAWLSRQSRCSFGKDTKQTGSLCYTTRLPAGRLLSRSSHSRLRCQRERWGGPRAEYCGRQTNVLRRRVREFLSRGR